MNKGQEYALCIFSSYPCAPQNSWWDSGIPQWSSPLPSFCPSQSLSVSSGQSVSFLSRSPHLQTKSLVMTNMPNLFVKNEFKCNEIQFFALNRRQTHTMTLIYIIKYGGDFPVSKLLCPADQGLPHRLISSQNHHFSGSKVHREHRAIFLGKLGKQSVKVRQHFDQYRKNVQRKWWGLRV